ncbi:nucleotide-binding protein [Methanofollis fontis]|uniref:Nucleotide-binding protein n=1 Tax=Methanofollis fontis TaxID=2052832 RepID=A0A483CMZ7_9EURY|nr:nucleotide-binding protein [Methanofollis fontis]TAJ44267.1 nucleotide-binding protein [Methanofollis fontis]
MEIRNVNVRMSALSMAVFAFFSVLIVITVVLTGELSFLVWAVPTLIVLLIIPLALNYLSQKQYADLLPVYEAESKDYRIKAINATMIGSPVRIRGIVEKAMFRFLNRPQFVVADRSGEISVKMFTTPQEDVKEGDHVEVLGLVIKRYIATGDPVINCVSIRKIDPEKKKQT